MQRLLLLVFMAFVAYNEVKAQYDVALAHYFALEPTFNPASIGKETKLNVTGSYAMNLTGFENNPRTMTLAADMPFYALKNYHGVGIALQNENIGAFSHKKAALQYAFRRRLFKGMLGVGVQLGAIVENLDGSRLNAEESNDPALATASVNGNSMDMSLGLYYGKGDKYYLGVSVQHLNAPLIELGETNELKIDATYYFTAGYNIKLRNPFLTIKPSMLFRTDGTNYRADVTSRLVYNNEGRILSVGLGYAYDTSITAMIGGSFHGFILGYSYEVYTSKLSFGNGSHEIFIGYQTDINLIKKGRNKHKSVRIL